jgi:phosphate transport system protein
MMARSLHARAALDDGLAQLQSQLRQLASLVDVAIERSILSLTTLDQRLAGLVISDDGEINRLRYQIEDRAIHLIATQQPIAGDLRFIIATLMVVSELERMGDYASGIARIVQLHEGRTLLKPLVDIPEMARIAREMLRDAVDAFIRRNEHSAERVAMQDDELDRLYQLVYRELLTYMVNDPSTIDRATWLLWAAHNLERVGDRIQNICERTVYEVTGTMKEFSWQLPPTEE